MGEKGKGPSYKLFVQANSLYNKIEWAELCTIDSLELFNNHKWRTETSEFTKLNLT